jgi:hypothetical protein
MGDQLRAWALTIINTHTHTHTHTCMSDESNEVIPSKSFPLEQRTEWQKSVQEVRVVESQSGMFPAIRKQEEFNSS